MGASSSRVVKDRRHGCGSRAIVAPSTQPPGVARGLDTFQVPVEVLDKIQKVFFRTEAAYRKERRWPSWFQGCSCCDDSPEIVRVPPFSFSVSEAETTSGMMWLWPADRNTFALFEPLFEATLRAGLRAGPAAGGPLELWTATIIVRRARRLEANAADFHTDYGHADVPPGFAFSLLTPLQMPDGAGGLQYVPWTKPYDPESADPAGEETPKRVPYRLGQVVAVDGKCVHRTEPYSLDDDVPSSTRAIVSLDVHSAAPERYVAGCRHSIRGQHDGNVYVRPNQWDDGNVSTDECGSEASYSDSAASV
eukprot:TRINITY_DN52239_c0_g1_i1.p1 TRINITY_DN52239_c0_g1~~TRINITY_DN52239_c0_g1_i1.p1  ORF type:complete len:307 (-),score=39.39 TRINITY_DN52239_c0_g1_i1:76-996(-)